MAHTYGVTWGFSKMLCSWQQKAQLFQICRSISKNPGCDGANLGAALESATKVSAQLKANRR